MNKELAHSLLREELGAFRSCPYSSLTEMIGKTTVRDLAGPDGNSYSFEIQVFWDSKKGGNIRVMGSVSSGGWSAFKPICDSFIKVSDDKFVGE